MKIESEQQQQQQQQQIEWRSKVLELDSQGQSQPEIARTLQVSVGTVNRVKHKLSSCILARHNKKK